MATYKNVDVDQLEANLTAVADAIRAKTGTTDEMSFPDGFVSAVDNIPEIKNQDITITENGTYTAESGFTGIGTVTVEVENSGSGGDPVLPPGAFIYYRGTASSTFELDFESSASGSLT